MLHPRLALMLHVILGLITEVGLTRHLMTLYFFPAHHRCSSFVQYGLKKKEEKEAEEKAAMEQACEGSLTRPKKAIPRGCGDDDEEDEESILDTVLKFLPGPLQDMFKK